MTNPTKKEKLNANYAVTRAVKTGSLVPAPCERCGKQLNDNGVRQIHAHHEDYSRPLDVVWLCAKCHGERHVEIRESVDVPEKARKLIDHLVYYGMTTAEIGERIGRTAESVRQVRRGDRKRFTEKADGRLIELFKIRHQDIIKSYREAARS